MENEKSSLLIKILIVVVVIALLVVVVFAVLVDFEREADLVPTFVCGQDQMIDNDGNRYNTAKIAGLCWMTENLRYLPSVSPSTEGSEIEPIHYVYGYQGTDVGAARAHPNFLTYGVLYNWPAAMTACPPGTRLPTDEEQHILERTFATGTCDPNRWGWDCDPAGTALKASSATTPIAWDGNNSSGFSALPAGFRSAFGIGSFQDLNMDAHFWTSSEFGSSAWSWYLHTGSSAVIRWELYKGEGFSVRCVKEETDVREVDEVPMDPVPADPRGVGPVPVDPRGANEAPVAPREADVATHNRLLVCGQDQMIDNDGNLYNTVEIGGICWMAANLRFLPSVSPSAVGSETEPRYYVYDYQGTDIVAARAHPNFLTYGVLYNWPAAMTACPSGTRLPTDEEFHIIERTFATGTCHPNRLGQGCDSAGAALKAAFPAWNGNNLSGFTALPAGFRSGGMFASFHNFTTVAYFWSSYESGSGWTGSPSRWRTLTGGSAVYRQEHHSQEAAFSVRCVR